MDDLIVEFLTETNESLDELDVDIVNLEQNPNDADLLGKIFRLMHTIKGTCGFLGLPRLEKCAHHAENVLGSFRDGDLEVTPDYVTLILESIDRIKFIIGELETTGQEPEGNDSELIAKLDAVFEGAESPAETEEPAAAEPEEKKNDLPSADAADRELAPGEVSLDELEAAFLATPGPEDMAQPEAPKEEEEVKADPAPKPPPAPEKKDAPADTGKKEPAISSQTLRVNVDVLENLMTMVSELVLTRNQLLQILRANTESEFSAPLQRLNHVVSELQEGVMKTRMQPIGNAWSKLPRIIRDLSLELNKKITLEMKGQDTELDRQVLEMIKDPLTHMVRNSGDHGIEMPADRIAAGKPEGGKVLLNAYHEGGHIIIQISDDGKGLSTDKIKDKIIEKGLADLEELETMSSQQIQQFIFKAGFSTAEQVTAVSGRGVGMDVVRTNIEKIGGSIELNSTEGKGSTFTIKIPLTLAIVSALIVESSKERFAIPQLSVRELVMISEHGDNNIEYIKGAPVFRLRDRLLPLVSLSDVLKLQSEGKLTEQPLETALPKGDYNANTDEDKDVSQASDETPENAESNNEDALFEEPKTKDQKKDGQQNHYIVVTQVGVYEFGIIVDRVFDTEEIVVKPVAKILKSMPLFSGNTILGDGSVIMILDPNGIANTTGGTESSDMQSENAEETKHIPTSARKTSLLIFSAGDQAPKAVPLSLVARLENIKSTDIEHSGGQMMVQYRGTLMPLIPFGHNVNVTEKKDMPVLVFSDKVQSMGLIVDEIIDIIEEHIDVQLDAQQQGLLGSAIIDGKATDVVDVAHFLNSINSEWFKNHGDKPFGTEQDSNNRYMLKRILLVDDSAFFRNMLTPLLSVAGYEVTSVDSPFEALQLCEDGATFDVIVSDIEMPEMNGFEFAERVKAEGIWQDTPMVALSSHATPQDIDRGLKVGFSNYVAKFDRDTLLDAINQSLSAS